MLGLIVPAMMTNPDLASLFSVSYLSWLWFEGREEGSDTQAFTELFSSNETWCWKCEDSFPAQEKESTPSACLRVKALAQEASWKLQPINT